MRSQLKKATFIDSASGFTLLEVVIALAILLITLLPLITFIYKNSAIVKAEQQISGMCILEQESMLLHCNNRQILPFKHKIINGEEWTTRVDKSGNDITTITMTVSKNKSECGKIVLYKSIEK